MVGVVSDEEFKQSLSYDPNTGLFIWLKMSGKVGQIAGSTRSSQTIVLPSCVRRQTLKIIAIAAPGETAPPS
jgi:hypothetical protein